MTIDAIVPCYNEEPRVGKVLQTLNDSPLIRKIIFVDGGSTDNSLKIAESFKKVKAVPLEKKGGKGQDVKEGLKYTESSAVFLCDADLIGLREDHIQKMLKKYEQNPQGLVVGLTQKNRFYSYHWIRANIFPLISGMRIISVDDLARVLSSPLATDYGIEPYMNYYFFKKRQPVAKVLLDGVNDIPKPNKENHGWKPHVEEAANLIAKYFVIYANEAPKDMFNSIKSFIFPSIESVSENFQTSKVQIDGLDINYVKTGQGRPLVFVHGWANNWEGWIPMISYLIDNYTLYLVDLPGFGDSGNLPEYSIDSASIYLARFIKSLPEKPVSVIGMSMGSLVVAQMGLTYPELVSSEILIGPIIKTGNMSIAASTLKYSLWFLKNFSFGESALKKVIETRITAYALSKYMNMYKFNRFLVDAYGMIGKKKMRKEAFTQMGISAANYNLNKVLEGSKIRTLLIYGREDKISSPQYAREQILPLNHLISCVDIPEAGHVVPVEKPKEVAQAIKEFLK